MSIATRLEEIVSETILEIKTLYLKDSIPWIIGFSGGKDSTTVVQLIFTMLLSLPSDMLNKKVYVISSDTLVENPIIEEFLNQIITSMRKGINKYNLPMVVDKVMPRINDTFWVNLLGKGYPSPTRFFRWCTDRLKIEPTSRYIQQRIDEFGNTIIVLGARKDESSTRAQVLENYSIKGNILRRHASMPQAFVYTPIANWSTEDVWNYLMTHPTPWDPLSKLNNFLRDLYRDASGECPLVIDKSTPSCGHSRFGCWTCTVITTDNSMQGFIDSGKEEYEWMSPLLEYRNKLKAFREDPSKRESWRKGPSGKHIDWVKVQDLSSSANNSFEVYDNRPIIGPFTLETRQHLLYELLEIEKDLFNKTGYKLIQEDELNLIRYHWTEDYRVSSLAMLDILEHIYGPSSRRDHLEKERNLLLEVCQNNNIDILYIDRLLDLERGFVNKLRKRGLLQSIDNIVDDFSFGENV